MQGPHGTDRYGDLRAWRRAGRLVQPTPPNLLDLVARRAGADQRTRWVFVCTGSALFDNLTVEYLLHGATEDR